MDRTWGGYDVGVFALALLLTLSAPAQEDLQAAWEVRAEEVHELVRRFRYEEAVALLEELRVLGPEWFGEGHPIIPEVERELGRLLVMLGDRERGLATLHRALAMEEAAFGREGLGLVTTLNQLALSELADYRFEAAEAHLVQQVSILEAHGAAHSPQMGNALANLAVVYERTGRLTEALETYDRALPLYAEDGVERAMARRVHNHKGRLLLELGRFAQARAELERSLAIALELGGEHHPDTAAACNNLAVLLIDQGDLQAAEALLTRSLAAQRAFYGDDSLQLVEVYANLGVLHYERGDQESSREAHAHAVALLEARVAPDDPRLALARADLAAAETELGHAEVASALFERALTAAVARLGESHPEVSYILNNRAMLLLRQGQAAEAQPLLRQALDAALPTRGPADREMAVLLANLAKVRLALSDRDGAREALDGSLAHYRARLDLLDALSEREAHLLLEQAASDVYLWFEAFDAPEDAARAWSASLLWKGAVTRRAYLRQALRFSADDPALAGVTEAWLAVRRRRLAGEGDDRALQQEQERLERALASGSARWQERSGQADPTADRICDALPDDAVLVDVLRYQRGAVAHYLAFVVRSDCSPERIELGPAAPIDEAVARWRDALHDAVLRGTELHRERGRLVQALVWQPLAAAVGDSERVVWVPDHALASVPLPALPVGGGRLLVETHQVQVLADAHDVVRLSPARTGRGLLAVGGVDYAGWQQGGQGCLDQPLADLPGTVEEVAALRRQWRRTGEPVTLLSGTAATEARVAAEAPGHRVLHLASHGVFAERCADTPDPMARSGLALARDGEDGVLTAAEVSLLDLSQVELAVLSACETARGEATDGEGVLGLQRGFALAGARSLITTLWVADDTATRQLMARFYRAMLRRGLAPAAALREAQLDLLAQQRRHGADRPELWAGFVVSGAVDEEER